MTLVPRNIRNDCDVASNLWMVGGGASRPPFSSLGSSLTGWQLFWHSKYFTTENIEHHGAPRRFFTAATLRELPGIVERWG